MLIIILLRSGTLFRLLRLECNIVLAIREALFNEVNICKIKSLTFRFVDGHTKTRTENWFLWPVI